MDRLDNKNIIQPKVTDQQLSDQARKSWRGTSRLADSFDQWSLGLAIYTFIDTYKQISPEELDELSNLMKGKNVVDLGCGANGPEFAKLYLGLGANSYTGVTLNWIDENEDYQENIINPSTKLIHDEALDYLLHQDDNSLDLITSNGFLCSELTSTDEYSQSVFKHINRVLKPNGNFIATHFDEKMKTLAEKTGLIPLNNDKAVSLYSKKSL